ncbi:GmrSD restriction endonuclease domain-containing protein [Demequina mangrovi]|uniref:Excalibur calcium-binding domain-containing protein n=1 Tax=Demequina mangrovi TaxID=1043493 RepID=A0A1H6UJD0_9MICO|nr:DUF1524 domain-containing protein [Demequina mangrovi]SEI91806.1 Excalibur calcium-binding domain-containing protein [Demequina mangrovi]
MSAVRPSLAALLGIGVLALAACGAPTETSTVPGVPTESATALATADASASPEASASPTVDASPSATATADDAGDGTARAALLDLAVKRVASSDGYSREQFGPAWFDVDDNGCDTRNDMLALRLTAVVKDGSCTVLEGVLDDPFTGTEIRFERGGASEIDIDHLVALSAAWQTGAGSWEYAKRVAIANDPLNLEPVDAGENRSKGDDDASEYLPPDEAFQCDYVARQIAVKAKYELWVTKAERAAMLVVLDTCPDEPLPDFGDQPVLAAGVGDPPEPEDEADEPAAKKSEDAPASSTDPRFSSCAKAVDAGYGPYVQGRDEEYGWYRDGDGDGTVCER